MPTTGINQAQQYAVPASDYATIKYYETDGSWVHIPGLTDIDVGDTERPRRDMVSMNTDPQARHGRPRVSSMTVQSLGMPQTIAWRKLVNAARDGSVLTFRLETNGVETFTPAASNPATAAVATGTGYNLTLANGASNGQAKPTLAAKQGLGEGALLRIGTSSPYKWAMVSMVNSESEIKAVDATTFMPPTTAFPAGAVAIFSPPPLRWEFAASVSGAAGLSLSAEGDATASVTITPIGQVALPTFYTDF